MVYHRVLAALCIAAVLLFVTAAASAAATGADATARERMSDGDITVVYGPGADRVAARVLEVAASRGTAVARQAGLVQLGPVVIYVASTDEEFRALTYGGVPDWGVGCAFPERGVVVLRNPLAAPDPLRMEDVIAHEIGHIAAGRVLKRVHVPRWFHEGIAMTLAGEWRLPRSSALAGAAASGDLIPLRELAGVFPTGAADAMLAYSESFYALRFLMEEAGPATPAEVLSAVAVAGSFEAGLRMLSGRTLEEFERDALASFQGRFGWGVFLTRWNVMFGVVTLFALIGGAARIARSRRLLREWEAEESRRAGGGLRGGRGSDSGWN